MLIQKNIRISTLKLIFVLIELLKNAFKNLEFKNFYAHFNRHIVYR